MLVVLGILLIVVGAVLVVIGMVVGPSKWGKLKSCTEHVRGRVVGVSPINYADHHIPVCSYQVNGQTYKVSGPKFESGTSGPGLASNLTTRDNLPVKLVGPSVIPTATPLQVVDNEYLYQYSAVQKLYPIGSEVDIWYDPRDPKLAYVQRPIREGRVGFFVLLILGLSVAAFGILCLIAGAAMQ